MTTKLSPTHTMVVIGLLSLISTAVVIGLILSRDGEKKTTDTKQTVKQTTPKRNAPPRQHRRAHFKPKFKRPEADQKTPAQHDPHPPQANKLDRPPQKNEVDTKPPTPPKVYTNKDKPHQTGPFEYKDPANKKILGPSAWMAQPTEAQRKSINDALDNSPAKAEQEKNKRRATAYQQALQLAKQAQTHCLGKWPLKQITQPRRVLLSMELEQRPKFGRVRKATVLSELNIGSEDHLTCLTDTLYNARTDVNIPMWITLKIPLTYQ